MAQRILDKLADNISSIAKDPAVPIDSRLFEQAELILPDRNISAEQHVSLTVSLSQLLPILQQDPSPAVRLLLALLRDVSYGEILKLGDIPFTDGLAVGEHMVAYNKLILSILEKASRNAADAASVASMLDTVLALVRLWLCTSDPGVTSQASQLLLDLLKVDQEITTDPNAHLPSGGQGLFWKRIFGDRDVYRMFFEPCSLTGPSSIILSTAQRTLAQARLMEWLPRVGEMDWSAITKSHHPEVEEEYAVQGGLLDFVALRLGEESKEDVLMQRCFVDFYTDILVATRPRARLTGSATDSVGLRYLITHGIHARIAASYLQLPGTPLDPLLSTFLYGPAANYIASYASQYPEHFLASQMPRQTLTRLNVALDLSAARWAHAESPKHDLHLLASLPRGTLLPGLGSSSLNASPLALIPSRSTNPDALNTLATVFHGPNREIVVSATADITQQSTDVRDQTEAVEARAAYYHYLTHNPRFWNDIATHADTVALKDLALAAINCLTAVITANWSEHPELQLPTTLATPPSGHLAILSPPALEYALPYLLKPPQTFANLVGGRGDAESAAYKIAAAKYDALRAFHTRLAAQVEQEPGQGYEEILATVGKRLAEGPLSREGEIGGRIGTLEL